MEVLSQAKAKQIRGLHQKKGRQSEGLFLVEGAKSVLETMKSDWEVEFLVATERFFEGLRNENLKKEIPIFETTPEKLAQISHFQSNNAALAVVRQKPARTRPISKQNLWLALDSISDPGNLGSIIRLADWFGLDEVICLGNVVDWYNPKTIAGTMGSFLRIQPVELGYDQLNSFSDRVILAADMHGKSLYDHHFSEKSILVIGNESHGISKEIREKAHELLTIPKFGSAESLNAAMATGIILSHWKSHP